MRAEARRGTCAARGAVHTCRHVHIPFRGSAGAARPARQDARLLLRAAAVPRLRARDGGKLGVGRGAALPAGEGRGVRGGAGRGGAPGNSGTVVVSTRAVYVLDGALGPWSAVGSLTSATLILRADPSYPTVALFHVSLTLRKILKRRGLQQSHRRVGPRASSCPVYRSHTSIHSLVTLASLKRCLNP